MSFLKRLFGKDKPSGEEHEEERQKPEEEPAQREEQQFVYETAKPPVEEHKEEQQVPKEEQVRQEEQQLLHERERLLIIEQRKAEYVLDESAPLVLDLEEARTRRRIAELENRCIALGIEPVEDALMMKEHLTRLLAKAHENLLLIESRKEEQTSEAESIQLSKAEQRWRARIAELETELGKE